MNIQNLLIPLVSMGRSTVIIVDINSSNVDSSNGDHTRILYKTPANIGEIIASLK
jgi:type IV secretory pathway component VirB8